VVKSLSAEKCPEPETEDERLAALFRVARQRPIDPFRKRRVLVRLERQQQRRMTRLWLRPVVLAALLVTGTAAAELGHRYAHLAPALFRSAPESNSQTSTAITPAHAPARVSNCLVSPGSSSANPVGNAPQATASASPGAARSVGKGSLRPESDATEDAAPVVAAIQALRTEGNPLRAQALLDDYLKAHPHGVLSGEALALSIEAASARHDPRAADYARRYLARFPRGKYRDLAARASAALR
jgi:hypothetical protein